MRGENTNDWDVFEQRINEQMHIIIRGSRYETTNDMLFEIGYPFLENVRRERIDAVFGHALDDGEHVNKRHQPIDRRDLNHQPIAQRHLNHVPDSRFVNLLNAPNYANILTPL